MAPREPGRSSAAEDVVFSNLGLKGSDLGVGADDGDQYTDDTSTGLETDQEDAVGDRTRSERPEREEPEGGEQEDVRRVTHTERQPFAESAEVKPDGKGNLVDAQGKIIAKAGREARLYQTAFKRGQTSKAGGLQHRLTEREGQLREAVDILRSMDTELKTLKAQNKATETLGIPAGKQLEALTLYKNLNDDFAGTLKRLLTRAAANGININEFGQSGPDAKALADLVKDEVSKLVRPLQDQAELSRQDRETALQARKRQDDAVKEVDAFFGENPEAVRYAQVLQKLAADPTNRGRSLDELWLRVQLHLARNPQVQRNRPNPDNRRSLPSGRSLPEGGNSRLAPVTTSYDDILKGVFADHGITK